MQRLAPKMVGVARLEALRDRIDSDTSELLTIGRGLVEDVYLFNPEAVTQKNVVARVGTPSVETGEVNSDGLRVLRINPLPEQPEEFVFDAVILPARKFYKPTTREVVDRRVAMNISVWYDFEEQSGVKNGLPLAVPTPNMMRLSSSVIASEFGRFKEPFPVNAIGTISGDFVRVYENSDDWVPVSGSNYLMVPNRNNEQEIFDWETLRVYPPEALTEYALNLHFNNIGAFLTELGIISAAIENRNLNPYPSA